MISLGYILILSSHLHLVFWVVSFLHPDQPKLCMQFVLSLMCYMNLPTSALMILLS
jgi:hypothetical protein